MSLGEALVTLRRARGITQETLAGSAAVTQAALSRYENDLRDPSDDTLGSLAAALGVTPEFLRVAGRIRGAFMVDAHMRRRRTARPTAWRRLEARLNVHRLHIGLLMREVEVQPGLALPLFDPLEYAPEDAARLVRMQWRMPSGPVRDLVGWLESAGCVVVAEDFGSMTGGGRVDGLSQWADDSPVMLVNDRAPTDRLRLTLAHELGHVCLHSDELGGDPEQEANAFAAEFLMPADVIRSELRNLDLGKLHQLKRCWGVSMQALIERAHRLGTVSAGRRTNLYKALSARGWRTREPLSDELSPERPRLVGHLGQALVDRGLSPDEVAVIAGAAPGRDYPSFLPKPRLSAV
jgi:Zn-dependent peptidase ImmA (M78 family)/DNA-binding XRE family transcriptional regulator